jgi:hypothetical protein
VTHADGDLEQMAETAGEVAAERLVEPFEVFDNTRIELGSAPVVVLDNIGCRAS